MSINRRVQDVRLLKSVGMSNVAIGRRLGISESTVRRDLDRAKRPKKIKEPHPHVKMVDPVTLETVEIDVLMAPLIQILWNFNIETRFCCQGEPTKTFASNPSSYHGAYIQMARDEESLLLIQSILTGYPPIISGRPTYLQVGFERYEKMDRICIRFPHNQIQQLTEFVGGL